MQAPSSSPPAAATPILSIQLLGGFRVSVGSHTIEEAEWRLSKSKQVVKLLALATNHVLQRDQVQELLWPEHGLDAAAKNFHVALYHARRLLALDVGDAARYLPLHRGQLALCRDEAYLIDVDAFEAAATIARHSRDLAAYQAAVKLYTGDLLPEDRYEDWAERRRDELRRTYLGLQLELGQLYLEQGAIEQAIAVLEDVVAYDPVHETAHGRLMRLYAQVGQRGQALQLYERLQKTLKSEFDSVPEAAIEQLYHEIRGGQIAAGSIGNPPVQTEQRGEAISAQPEQRHNLPAQLSSFVGRATQLADLTRLLSTSRLLTLVGIGGSGKTRLALQLATEVIEHYRDGVWLVELAPLSDPRFVPQAIMNALALEQESRRQPLTTLKCYLQTKALLLVLDNCEHLIDACAHVVQELLASCPELRVVSTSRAALRVPGEVLRRVPTLALPESNPLPALEQLASVEAIRLFVDRARSREPGFALTEANAASVVEICRRLDGLPLAIELAAARVDVVPVRQLASRLDDALVLLTGGSRTVLRQQTLRATLDWSYHLLALPEQTLFKRLSIFAGSWSLEAAEAVGMGEAVGGAVLEVLAQLVDQSLVVAEHRADGAIRYRMLEPVRQYAQQGLAQSGEAALIARRHALVFLALSEAAEEQLTGPQQAIWLARMEEEHDNLRAALAWSLEHGEAELGLRLAAATRFFWQIRGHLDEGCRWLQRTLANGVAAPVPIRAKALSAAAALAEELGDYSQAAALWEQGLALWRTAADRQGISLCLNGLAHVAGYMGDYTTARAMYTESLAIERELGVPDRLAITLNDLALVLLLHDGDYPQAMALLKESLELERQQENKLGMIMALNNLALGLIYQREYPAALAVLDESIALGKHLGDKLGLGIALLNVAMCTLDQGDYEQSCAAIRASLTLFQDQGFKLGVAACLEEVAALGALCGEPQLAVRCYGAAETLREELNAPLWPTEHLRYQHYLAIVQTQLDAPTFAAAHAEGRSTPLETVVAQALALTPICARPG